MSAELAIRFCDKQFELTTDKLKAEVAALRPEDDPEVLADMTVRDFVVAAAALVALPPDRIKAEIADLQLAASQVDRKLFRVRFT